MCPVGTQWKGHSLINWNEQVEMSLVRVEEQEGKPWLLQLTQPGRRLATGLCGVRGIEQR